jgi:hypothetical protein
VATTTGDGMGKRWLAAAAAAALLVWIGNGSHGDHTSAQTPQAPQAAQPTKQQPATGNPPPSHAAPSHPASAAHRAPAKAGTAKAGTALEVLATLPVKGRAPLTGYDRDRFGQAWLDTNRNGCDTRGDILSRDLTRLRYRAGTGDCVVEAGVLADPYTGRQIHYVRGNDTVDIDHVVALGDAWQTGAQQWVPRERAAFANDPMNLLAVDSSANRQKGDGDTATWLPSNRAGRCAYVARQVSVKGKYHLWVTPAEHAAMARVLAGCPDRKALTGGLPVISPVQPNAPHTPSAATHAARPGGGPSGPVDYANCDAVRAAGAAPIHRGDPGYAAHLDRDGDGVGCE